MYSGLTRRQLLKTGVGVSITAGAGWWSFFRNAGGGTEPVPIHRLSVENHTTEEHTVHLQLLDKDDISYWRSVQVPVTDPDGDVLKGLKAAPGFPRPPGEYTLLARLDENPEWQRVDYTDVSVSEGMCFEVTVTVEDENTLGFLSANDAGVCKHQP